MEKICNICPRKCHINKDKTAGFCGTMRDARVDKIMLHYYEEPCISGTQDTARRGSGAIFFSGCNLKCVYCQNYEISHAVEGKIYSPEELAGAFKSLECQGATNINLVTPTHYADQILLALNIYTPKIPIVWNSSGYENVDMIKKIIKKVKVFLFDFKYFSNEYAKKYSACPDYFENCTKSLKLIKKAYPKNKYEGGLLTEGVIIRHLVLPSLYKDSQQILDYIKKAFGTDVTISLLGQYTPCGEANKYPEINRKLKPIEYKKVLQYAQRLGFTNGYQQELSSASTEFIPEFRKDKKNK